MKTIDELLKINRDVKHQKYDCRIKPDDVSEWENSAAGIDSLLIKSWSSNIKK